MSQLEPGKNNNAKFHEILFMAEKASINSITSITKITIVIVIIILMNLQNRCYICRAYQYQRNNRRDNITTLGAKAKPA